MDRQIVERDAVYHLARWRAGSSLADLKAARQYWPSLPDTPEATVTWLERQPELAADVSAIDVDGPLPSEIERPRVQSLAELLAKEIPEPPWIVSGLIPVGLSVLAGRPKLGKSFMALQLAIAIGSGGMFLNVSIDPGRALYIALEDSEGRMQRRARQMNATGDSKVDFAYKWDPLNSEGLGDLSLVVPNYDLVIVDTLTRAITSRTDWDSVGEVTGILDSLHHMALDSDMGIMLIDHHRKSAGFDADVVSDVLGSTAKSAVCDTILGLYRKRGEHGATLRATGRDIEEQTMKLTFDEATGYWHRDDVTVRGVQAEIIKALKDQGPMRTTELADYLDKDKGQVSRELAELEHKGKIRKSSDSRLAPWELADDL